MVRKDLPLIYSCSGCSNVAQLANSLAVRLDRAGKAEMSCIAGVGGKVPKLVKDAKSGRRIIAIDGCMLHCAKACLEGCEVQADVHLTLSDFGVRKRYGEDCSEAQIDELEAELLRIVDTLSEKQSVY